MIRRTTSYNQRHSIHPRRDIKYYNMVHNARICDITSVGLRAANKKNTKKIADKAERVQ